ncbi:MAK10-like protein [Tanacetum coccineum]
MGDENPICTPGDYSKLSHKGYRNTIELLVWNNVVPHRSDTIRLVQNGCSFYGLQPEDPDQHLKLRNLNAEESWALLKDLALYDNESWNDSRDFAKPVKAITLAQDVPSTSDHRLIELENQVQRLMEAHLALTQPTQVNKITTSCEICIGPHDTQYCMEDTEHAFVQYASSCYHDMGNRKLTSDQGPMSFNEATNTWKDKPNLTGNKLKHSSKEMWTALKGYNKGIHLNVKDVKTIIWEFGNCQAERQGIDTGLIFHAVFDVLESLPAEMDIRLSLSSHSYIYPLGIAEDVLVKVAEHVYPVDFIILDIKENENRPFILGTPFLTMAKAMIKFDKGTITLRYENSKISFNRIPESLCKDAKGIKNDIESIASTMTVNRLVLEWEEKIKLHQEKEMEFD